MAPTHHPRDYLPILDAMRITAVIAVVAIHCMGTAVAEGTAPWWLTALDMAFVSAVPIFFMMSGALTLHPSAHRHGVRSFWRSRLERVLPALVVWSAFYIVAIDHFFSGNPLPPGRLITMIITGDTHTHLYFLWAIVGLYLLSPLFAAFLAPVEEDPGREARRALPLGIALLLWALVAMAIPVFTSVAGEHMNGLVSIRPVSLGALTFPLVYAGYYVLGRALVTSPPLPRKLAVLFLLASLPCIWILTELYIARREGEERGLLAQLMAPGYLTPIVALYSLMLFAAVYSLGRTWRVSEVWKKRLRALGNATFGVFLVHFAIMLILRRLFGFDAAWIPGIAIIWALTTLASFAFALIGARIPGLSRIL